MASNSFGKLFRITTFGESHGAGIGVVIDGCPAGLDLDMPALQDALLQRSPGRNNFVSPRKEKDACEVLSGLFEGQTTGTPLTLWIANKDHDSSKYEAIKMIKRPGHANVTYLEKYGIFDHRGGGRASARETAARVAAGAVAKQILAQHKIHVAAYLQGVGGVKSSNCYNCAQELQQRTLNSAIFCPDTIINEKIENLLAETINQGDSLGGFVGFLATGLPAGLGEPIYDKLEANIAKAMMSIPASKGFEIGSGFEAAQMFGSEHNDCYIANSSKTSTNNSGGILGGISNGMPIFGSVAFKPTSSIKITQNTSNLQGDAVEFKLPQGSRHDPCVAIRAVIVVEAMLALVLVDALLAKQTNQMAGLQ